MNLANGIGVLLAGAATVAATMLFVGTLYAFPLMWIWDYIMPDLFGLPTITFWQAFWGLFMCFILFKGQTVTSK